MGLVDSLIVASCISFSGTANDACQKALQAGSKQSGVEQQVNTKETEVTKKADATAKEMLGETTVGVVGGTVFIAKSVSDKKATLNLPTLGLCSNMKLEVGKSQSELKLEWKF